MGASRDQSANVLDQVQEGRLGPVDVVEDQDQRTTLGQGLEQATDGPEGLLGHSAVRHEAHDLGDALGDQVGALRAFHQSP